MAPKCSAAIAFVWNWVIEALASNEQVDTSTILGLVKSAPIISDNAGKNARELVSLRILESLFDLGNEAVVDTGSAQNTKVRFDTSERCEDVLYRILHETPTHKARLDKEKWDVRPFLMHKRSSLPKCVLKRLKDAIHENSHPLLASLKEKSKLVTADVPEDTGPVIDNIQDALGSNDLALNPGKGKNVFKDVLQEADQLRISSGGITEHAGSEEQEIVLERSLEEVSCIKLVKHDAHTNSQHDRQQLDHNDENSLQDTSREGYDGRNETATNSVTFDDDRADIAAQKSAFFNSQLTLGQDSFSMTEFSEMDLCMKCNEGGQLLVCSSESCALRVHESCLGSAVTLDENHKFFCPFCTYSRAISEYLEAKQKVSLARKSLQAFSSFTVDRIPNESSKKQSELEKTETEAFPGRNAKVNTASRANISNQKSNEDNSSPPDFSIRVANHDMDIETGCLNQQIIELTQNPTPQVSTPKQKGKVRDSQQSNESTFSRRLRKRKAQYNCESNEEDSVLPDPLIRVVNEAIHIETGCVNKKNIELPQSPLPEASGSKQKSQIRKSPRSTEPICSKRLCRGETKYILPPLPCSRRNIVPWTKSEEEMLKEGVERYSGAMYKRIPWNEILNFGRHVFQRGRTNIDLKDKWRNMCKRNHDA